MILISLRAKFSLMPNHFFQRRLLITGYAFLLILFLATYVSSLSAQALADSSHISEERFIRINGIEQWVSINGNKSKPAILFLHGGPGSPMSPYSAALYGDWQKDFIIVQWDQRGSGRTFGKYAPAELDPAFVKANPLTVSQMTADGIELASWLTQYLGKQKIILLGTSWGSALAVLMATQRPDLFYAYIGHSQIVNPGTDLTRAYKKVYRMAEDARDQKAMALLQSIGAPPYDTARTAGRLFRIIKQYEASNAIPMPDSLWEMAPIYNNGKDAQHRSDGDDYSFLNYVGDKRWKVQPMMSTINLLESGLDFKIPVYLIQGEEDILTPKETTTAYFEKINAPAKKYFLLPKTAHGFNLSVLETQRRIIEEYILPAAFK
jgi:pimeloyl-ACP methyl ester carboxylesterase